MKWWVSAGLVGLLLMAGTLVWFRPWAVKTVAVQAPAAAPAPPPTDVLCRLPDMVASGGPMAPAPAPVSVPGPPLGPPPIPVASAVMAGMPMKRTAFRPVAAVAVAAAQAPAQPAAPAPEENAGEAALEQVQGMLRDFRTRMGDNPVGSNAEIMRAVMGGNPVQARLGPPPGQQVNAQGELLDPWGTPLFFHQLSAKIMEVRSAGPDRSLWTSDDLESR